MEESMYRMSLVEVFLVFIVIILWFFAVINLIRKLERICNPPSAFLNYSIDRKISLTPSKLLQRYPIDSTPCTRPLPKPFLRALSEPTIYTSSRATMFIRLPSETLLHTKSSSSPSVFEQEVSKSSLNLSHQSSYLQTEMIANRGISAHKLLYPKRLPSIVRRSLLDLHRRTFTSNQRFVTTTNNSPTMNAPIVIPLALQECYRQKYSMDEKDLTKMAESEMTMSSVQILSRNDP